MNGYSNNPYGQPGNGWPLIVLVLIALIVAGIFSLGNSDVFNGETNRARVAMETTQTAMHVAQTATPAAAHWRATEVAMQQTAIPYQATVEAQAQSVRATRVVIDDLERSRQAERDARHSEAQLNSFIAWAVNIFLVCFMAALFGLALIGVGHWLRTKLRDSQTAKLANEARMRSLVSHITSAETQLRTINASIQAAEATRAQTTWDLQRQQQDLSRAARHNRIAEDSLKSARTRLDALELAIRQKEEVLREVELRQQAKEQELQALDSRIAERQRIVDAPWFEDHGSENNSGNGAIGRHT